MLGGAASSMVWTRMPGQSWPGAAASFVGMWTVMMAAMMLPSITPVLWQYRESAARARGVRPGRLAAVAGIAYVATWSLFGFAIFPLGAAVAEMLTRAPALLRLTPAATGVIVLLAGALQLTAWKARYLACCREAHWRGRAVGATTAAACRDGVRLAAHCACCGAGFTAVLLALGVMDLRVMTIVAVAGAAERLAPDGARVARAIGVVTLGAGLLLRVRGMALG